MAVRLERIREFTSSNALALKDQLQRFEKNVSDAVLKLDAQAEMPDKLVAIVVASGDAASPRVGQITRYDTTNGDILALLQPPSSVVNRWFPVIKLVGSNTLRIRPVSGTINGAATLVVTAVGVRWIYSDGSAYYA